MDGHAAEITEEETCQSIGETAGGAVQVIGLDVAGVA